MRDQLLALSSGWLLFAAGVLAVVYLGSRVRPFVTTACLAVNFTSRPTVTVH